MHPGQTCPNSKEKDLDTRDKIKEEGATRIKAREAAKDALEEELIEEMYRMIL